MGNYIFFIILFVISTTFVFAGESYLMGLKMYEPYKITFNQFDGTFAGLPNGIGVSKDGVNIMSSDDSDFRGINDGDVKTGGCYAWDLGFGDKALGYQPTSDEFTPGFFYLSISNGSDEAILKIKVDYDIIYKNNEDRSISVISCLIFDGVTNISPNTEVFITPMMRDNPSLWEKIHKTDEYVIADKMNTNGCFMIVWNVDDVGGSGARDEIGIDNITLELIPFLGLFIAIK